MIDKQTDRHTTLLPLQQQTIRNYVCSTVMRAKNWGKKIRRAFKPETYGASQALGRQAGKSRSYIIYYRYYANWSVHMTGWCLQRSFCCIDGGGVLLHLLSTVRGCPHSKYLWSPYVIGQTLTFSSCGFYLLFFPCLISAVGDWMSTILWHMVWSYCKFRMQV